MKMVGYKLSLLLSMMLSPFIYTMDAPSSSNNTIQNWQSIVHDEQLLSYHLDQKNISASVLNTTNYQGLTPLDIFWKKRPYSDEIMEKLVACGATNMEWATVAKINIHKEASQGNYAAVKLAVIHNPYVAHTISPRGLNAINSAARGCHCLVSGNGHAEVVRFLLSQNVKSTLTDQDQELPIHHAAAYGENNILEQLLQYDSSLVNRPNIQGLTAVHCAAFCRWESRQNACVKSIGLLRTYGAEMNKKDKQGRTPLMIAVQRGNLPIIEYLLECKVRCNIADNQGNYPLHYVMQAKTDSVFFILHLLLNHGSFTLLDVANNQGHTPLQSLDEAEREYAQKSDQKGLWRCSQIRMILHDFPEKKIQRFP